MCQFPESQGWDLKYRASRDGFSGPNFHTKCDGVSNTLTIIKTTNGNIFGAFAEQAWTNGSSVEDEEAFVISLINKENKPFKAMISSTGPQIYYKGRIGYYIYALCCNSSNGPCFGYDNRNSTVGILIASDSNANQSSSSNFGYAFKHHYPAGTAKSQAILAGSQNFQTTEIEVFTKKDSFSIIHK